MSERFVVIACATVLAGVVLSLSLLSQPSTPIDTHQAIDEPLDINQLPSFDPNRTSSRLDPRGQAKKYRINSINRRGQLIELYGDTLTPLPNGVSQVAQPGARIHLTPHRVLRIRAKQGTILAPDNQIRSGQFNGDVNMTLFDSPTNRPVEVSQKSNDAKLQLAMQDARFDMELGQIESDQAIHLTGPSFDFRGVGLSLNYNQRRRRIERLQIMQGQSLRFQSAPASPPDDPTPSTETSPQDQPTDQPEPQGTTALTPTSDPTQATQFYRAKFDSQVRITTPHATIEADRLEIVFCIQPQAGQDPTQYPLGLKSAPPQRVATVRERARSTQLNTTHSLTRAIDQTRFFKHTMVHGVSPTRGWLMPLIAMALATATPNDAGITATQPDAPQEKPLQVPPQASLSAVTITWTGQLLVEPEDSPPIDIAGPHDSLIELVGQPVRITTPRNQVVTAASMDYLASEGRSRVLGSQAHPLTIQSPTMGTLHAQRLVLHQTRGTGQIIGAGTLHTIPTHETDPIMTVSRDAPTPAPGLQVAWNDRVDLTFYPNSDDASPASPSTGRQLALQQALFHGRVQVQHPQFNLNTDTLTVGLGQPDPTQTHQRFQAVNADGHVRFTTRDDHDTPVHLDADHLTVGLTPDASGQPQPSAVTAWGSVHAHQPDRSLQAARLEIALDHSISASDTPSNPNATYALNSVTAQQDVRVQLNDLGVRIAADRLEADTPNDQLHLFGLPDTPAHVNRHDGSLTGQHITVGQQGQAVHVLGSGSIDFISTPAHAAAQQRPPTASTPLYASPLPNDQAAAPQQPLPLDPEPTPNRQARVRVTWDQAMHFDNRFGLAQFVGQVVANADSDREQTQLFTEDLRLEFTQAPQIDLPPQPDTSTLTADTADPLTHTGRTVRMVTARNSVLFLATQWADTDRTQLETRMRVTGPLISFDNIVEQIQIIGPGRMLLEDYRPRSDRRKHDPNAAALFGVERTGQVKFTGRGATLLKWSGQLLLDAFHNDLRADSGVQMIHRSRDAQLTAQLDCQRLLADLEATGGLGLWLGGDTPQPRVKAIYADRDVRVLSDERTIQTDHLEYTGFDQVVLLKADPGRLTQIHEAGRPAALTAQRFRWDLYANRLEILKPGPSRIPME